MTNQAKPDLYTQLETLSQPREKSAKRNASEVVEHTVEDANGKTISAKKYKRSSRQTEPDFIKLYVADLARLYGCHPRVLTALAKRMEYQSNLVALTPRVKDIVARECGFKNTGSLRNALSKLSSEGLIKKIGPSEYMIDPKVFGKGTWEKIEHARSIYNDLSGPPPDTVKVQCDLAAHFEMADDKKADKEVRADFQEQCQINEMLARSAGHIDFD